LDSITIHCDVVVRRYVESGNDVLSQCLTQDIEDWALFRREAFHLV
jgi:hypothetical protein